MAASTLPERTFHPYYVSSPLQRFILKRVIPGLAIFVTVFVVWFLLKLPGLVTHETTEAQRRAAFPLLVALALLVGTMPLPFFALWLYMDREYLRHTITIDSEGIVQHKGKRERRCAWPDVARISTLTLGRLQIATVHTPRGKIRFDASMVDRDAPQPRRVMDLKHEYLEYPDGARQRLKLDDNALFKLVCTQAPEAAMRNRRGVR